MAKARKVMSVISQTIIFTSFFLFVSPKEPERHRYEAVEHHKFSHDSPLFMFKREVESKKSLPTKKAIIKPKLTFSKNESDTDVKDPARYKVNNKTTNTTVGPDITKYTEDHHTYYNSSRYLDPDEAKSFWIDLESMPSDVVKTHQMLSNSHRHAATVSLLFDFPFYGHVIRNITIATGGFLYTGDYVHNWLAATQYIAPLMANFDTSVNDNSTIKLADNGTMFVVQWDEVALRNETDTFTFQVSLFKNGDIIFVYKKVPIPVTEIKDLEHPVKIGLSDAYILESETFAIRRKTIYEYHRIDMKEEEIGNLTAIYFKALLTCQTFKDCDSCSSAFIGFDCSWCEAAGRCSDGVDRHRQVWITKGCENKETSECPKPTDTVPFIPFFVPPGVLTTKVANKVSVNGTITSPHTHSETVTTTPPITTEVSSTVTSVISTILSSVKYWPTKNALVSEEMSSRQSSISTGGVVAILLIFAVIIAVVIWIGYAYRNPQTTSGQFLIKYRPSQWHQGGQARYTAASIHM